MEYYAYKPGKLWCLREILKVLVICIVVAMLFYNKILVAPFLFPIGCVFWRLDAKAYKKSMKNRLRNEFKEFIIILSGSLNAGYSLEQAIRVSCVEINKDSDFKIIPREIGLIVNGLNLNKDLEDMLLDMGKRCEEAMIMEFASLVATAKKYGGNIAVLINKTKAKLNDKVLVEREIETMIAAKKLEGKIMLFMPFGIMAYMQCTNGEYIELIYKSMVGNVVMTIALMVILVCGMITSKITEIEV